MHAADPALRKQRKQKGGNTGKNFTEGWVEFEDKAVAKQVAAMLNSNPIGGKRRSAYHYDLWSLKYLPKFKWDHLTEEIGMKSICSAVYTLLLGLISLISHSHITVRYGRVSWLQHLAQHSQACKQQCRLLCKTVSFVAHACITNMQGWQCLLLSVLACQSTSDSKVVAMSQPTKMPFESRN